MSARKSPLLLHVPAVILREQRVFRLHFLCDACTETGSEWVEEALVVRSGYCPCCDAECQAYGIDELFETMPEFDLSEDECDGHRDAAVPGGAGLEPGGAPAQAGHREKDGE